MTKIDGNDAGFYLDLSKLKSVRGQEGLSAAAEGFETMFLQLVLKNMRAGADVLADPENPLTSQQQRFFRELYDAQLATNLSAGSDFGIAEQIQKQMGGVIGPVESLKNSDHPVALSDQDDRNKAMAAFQQPLRMPTNTRH